jgi:Domain of unknown function (DUF6457)
MDEWLTGARDTLAKAAGIPASELDLTQGEVVTLLDLAALAAHKSGQRTNAPLVCYLVGKAERGANLDALAGALREAE